MTDNHLARAGFLAAALLLAGGCATSSYLPMQRPSGATAFGLTFGAPREKVEAQLNDAEIPFTAAPGDPDALLASSCPAAPARTTCRLLFGAKGLFAAQLEAPPSDAGRLVRAAQAGLGDPTRRGDSDATPGPGAPAVVAAWEQAGWTVGVAQRADAGAAPVAVLRVELDAATAPAIAGVALGQRRADVEQALKVQGAVLVQRDDESTTYLGCPQGDGEALTCVVSFHEGRAASVTEVHPTPTDDDDALAAWKGVAAKVTQEIGREPVSSCPASGPERATGDCTSIWASERLIVVVGAHRGAGGKHRGTISVYTSWSYPPLAPAGGGAPGE
jgi:hypothetical protein